MIFLNDYYISVVTDWELSAFQNHYVEVSKRL